MGNIGAVVTEWRCSRCNAVVGRGPEKPDLSRCPNCSASFGWPVVGGIGGAIILVIGVVVFAIRKAMA
jgi:hypothetical protein